jgi:hypothetical protein
MNENPHKKDDIITSTLFQNEDAVEIINLFALHLPVDG